MDFILRRLNWKVKPSPMALVVEVLHRERDAGKRRLFSSHMPSQSPALCVSLGRVGGGASLCFSSSLPWTMAS